LINAFGVFQEYYTSFTPPLSTPSSISWTGTVQTLLLLLIGSATGKFVDRGFAQRMAAVGGVLVTLAMVLTSISGESAGDHRPKYYQVLLSQGVLSGLGMSLLLVPSTAIIPTYFVAHRALAVGLANAGASVGGVVYPVITRQLLNLLGFSWAMRVTALVVFITTGLGSLLLRQRHEMILHPTKRTLYDIRCLREPCFATFVTGIALCFAGSYVPYFYVTTWLRQIHFPLHGIKPYYVISILNAGGLFGRIIPSFLADKVKSGPILMQALAAIACGALAAGWTYMETSVAGLITWVVAYGFFSGSVICLIPATAATLTDDMSRLGSRLGVVFAANAFASLMGNPVAGAILKSDYGGWRALAYYSAGLSLAGGCLLLGSWRLDVRAKNRRTECS
jgi:MFS family permease